MKYKLSSLTKTQHSRTTNTIINFIAGLGKQGIEMVLQFVVRTVFIHTLGKSYLGVSGLFTNILTMLNLAELGIGSAILFKLYKPLAAGNELRVATLMDFYKKIYRVIGAFVAIAGLVLIPFLPSLIKNYESYSTRINIPLIFCLYLARTVFTYIFFAFKSAIIQADQKVYLINVVNTVTIVITSIAQVICLLVFKNFIIYVLISVLQVLLQNVICAFFANRMYPYINRKDIPQLSREERIGIFKDCGALSIYKLNGVVLKATDNIILSKYAGLEMVGLYSNYYVFYTTISQLFSRIYNAMAHSLGNLHAVDKDEHECMVFQVTNFLTAVLGAISCVGIACVSDDFVRLWIGNDWVIPQPFATLMGIELYGLCYRKELSRFRTSMGLFQQAKFRPLAGMIINLVVSLVLVQSWGICGVLVGTIAADWLTILWYDPLIIMKYGLKGRYKPRTYFSKQLFYLLTTVIVGAVDFALCRYIIPDWGWFSVILEAVLCGVSVPAVFIAISWGRPECDYLLHMFKRFRNKIFRRRK